MTEITHIPPPLGLEPGAHEGEFLINMGPQHPSTHGVLRLVLRMEGEVIRGVWPVIGYLHRNHEKIAESRPYSAFTMFSDRLDYLASMNMNLGYAIAVERLCGFEVPERAEHIRVIMAELNRIASHLVWFGTYGLDLGAWTPMLFGFREREQIIDLFEMACGARLTYSYIIPGGVTEDLPDGFVERARAFLRMMPAKLREYDDLLGDNVIFRRRVEGIAPLDTETAVALGVTGPLLRATGLRWDLRRDAPYSIYDRFDFEIPTGTTGDCMDRYTVRMTEIRESLRIIEQALDALPDGPIQGKVPRVIRAPKDAEIYDRTESPRGEYGIYIVSDGKPQPWRLKVRAPSFSNLMSVAPTSIGLKIADLVAIVGSIDIVMGEVDR
ncbi:NADH-quinone oxidoreductase subunit D [Candidatus Sumerlaeota bacterium]|nr:NADH-quinone oxidoreductase subunit D [Candidatus Sumerlaeota bacterium]